MKSVLLVLLVIFSQCFNSLAQQNYFVYLQSENTRPFYVRYKSKVYSSSNNGYLIMSKLGNGEHKIKIGFPKSNKEEVPFLLTIKNEDQGYKLRTAEEKLSLFNLIDFTITNTLEEYTAKNEVLKQPTPIVENTKENTIISKSQPIISKPENSNEIVKKEDSNRIQKEAVNNIPDTLKVNIQTKQNDEIKATKAETNDTVKFTEAPIVSPEKEEKRNTAKPNSDKISVSFTTKSQFGIDAIYTVESSQQTDTIRIFIPSLKNSLIEIDTAQLKVEPIAVPSQSRAENKISKNNPDKDVKFLEFDNKPKDTILQIEKPIDTIAKESLVLKKVTLINSDCKKIADNTDYLNLRKKLAGEENLDVMLKIATKAFKQKCYLVDQIRNISGIFLTDESKLDFFVAAYPYIYDTEEYKTLVSEFRSFQIIEKFNTLIKN